MSRESNREEYTVCDQCRAKKIRCGREKPSCGNCNRLGLQCEWSGQGKKCNQTALLSHTILGLANRLENLETSNSDIQNSLKKISEELSNVSNQSNAPARRGFSQSRPSSQSSPQWSPDLSKTQCFTKPLGRFLLDQNNTERYFGSTSPESLMLNIKDAITEIEAETPTMKDCILQAQHRIDLLVGQADEEPFDDKSPPTAPPFAILDAMIEPYFATASHHFPIWTKETFSRMATALRQSTPSKHDLASIICCNNLILMALSANSICSQRRESMQTNQERKTSSMDLDVIAGFLANSKRALKYLDQFVSPRLINVQALLSLYLVAQEHLSVALSETLFALAARCAKSIGIHQWQSLKGQLNDADIEERRNISYCLYVLDKTVCHAVGSSPNVPFSDVEIDQSLVSSQESITSFLVAKAELAKIEESIYQEIYAIQVKSKSQEQVGRFATTSLSRLQGWLNDLGIDLDEIEKSPESSTSKLELTIRFLAVQLLLIWPHKQYSDVRSQQSQEIAQKCMRFLLRLWRSPTDKGHHAGFPLLLSSLSPLYLYEILTQSLNGQVSNSDMAMLQEFISMLQIITYCRGEKSYNRRLYQLTVTVMDVMNSKKTQHKRRRSNSEGLGNPQSDYAPFYSQVSELLSPPASSYNYMTSNSHHCETGQSAGFDYGGLDNSFAFLSPINSSNGGLNRTNTDETFPRLGGHAKGGSDNFNFLTRSNSSASNIESSRNSNELFEHTGSHMNVMPDNFNALAMEFINEFGVRES